MKVVPAEAVRLCSTLRDDGFVAKGSNIDVAARDADPWMLTHTYQTGIWMHGIDLPPERRIARCWQSGGEHTGGLAGASARPGSNPRASVTKRVPGGRIW